jgi:hypothetical protein
MEIRAKRLFHGILFCSLSATLPAVSQAPQQPPPRNAQTKPATGARPQPGNRPNPGGGSAGRPQPARPQPARPQPGTRPPQRPNPPRPNPGNRPPGRPNPGRPPQWGRPPANRPSYGFRPTDRAWLRRHYASRLRYINRARRPVFTVGGYFPYGDIGYLSPLPPDVYGYLPPPPPGYRMGYWDGYVVVYDPFTYFIANLIDLME